MASVEWIDRQFVYLSSKLGVFRLHSGDEFFFEPTPGFYGFISQGTNEALNEAMRMLATHIGSLNCPIIEDWEGLQNPLVSLEHDYSVNDEPPGLIYYDGPNRSRIRVCITNKHSSLIMGAILAHELTHYYLFDRGIILPEEAENERFTDLATAYLGLGKLTLNGYDPISWIIKRKDREIKYTFRVGYLTSNEMALILYQICKFRNISFEKAQENLSPKSMALLSQIKLTYEGHRKEREREKSKIRKFINKLFLRDNQKYKANDYIIIGISKASAERFIIIACGKCNQKIRLPLKEIALRVKCPGCENKFIFHPKQD